MKNLLYAGILLFMVQSCTKDFIELEPKVNRSEANAYHTEADALLAVAAVYDALSVQNWDFVPIMSDIRSDDSFCGGVAGGSDMSYWQEMEMFKPLTENEGARNLWNRCYSGIYRANQFLGKAEEIEWKTEATKNRMIAETKFIRGYFYWDLVRHFGWVPIILQVYPDVEAYKTIPQSEPLAVYKQIATDMLEAVKYCPPKLPSTEIGRVTKYAAQSMLSRIYLYYTGFAKPVFKINEEWSNEDGSIKIDKAYIQAALKEVIGSNQYDLLPTYAEVFDWANDQNTKENVFSWQYSEKSKVQDWSGWNCNGNFECVFLGPRGPQEKSTDTIVDAGWSFSVPTWNLVNEFKADNDPRLNVSVYYADTALKSYVVGFQNTGYFNFKFMGLYKYRSKVNFEHNYPINYPDIRFSDVLLMASEVFLTDDPALSQDYFNRVRKRAFGNTAVMPTVSLDAIYHERRMELSGEGHRYWDLLRRGLDYAAEKINAGYSSFPAGIPNADDFEPLRTFDPNTYGMLPIPASEIRLTNFNLKQFIPAFK